MNRYQRHKAEKLAGCLLRVLGHSTITLQELPELAARLSNDEWRSISFAAGVPTADLPAKRGAVEILRAHRRRVRSSKVVTIR